MVTALPLLSGGSESASSLLWGVSIVRADDFGRSPDPVALGRREQWVPNLKNQHGSPRTRPAPRPVLDGVIEHPGFAGLPLSRFAADAESAVRRHDQRQVHRQPRVGDARMRRYLRTGIEDRKKCGGSAR